MAYPGRLKNYSTQYKGAPDGLKGLGDAVFYSSSKPPFLGSGMQTAAG
jgi:hypothetical protein